jgi:protein-disulfide isomerase
VSRKLLFISVLFLTAFRLSSLSQSTPANQESTKQESPASNGRDSKPAAPKSSGPATLETRVEKYLRDLYAWGPDYEVKVGTPKPSPIPDLLEVPITVSKEGQSDTASVYVSKSGKYMVRGELTDMTADPFADVAAKLHVGDSPTLGPADAKVTLIEFADFECPACRQLDLILRDLLPKHPEVRLVFKQFPLTDIHPWAMTAALATQCVYEQSPAAFWKMHDAIYDAQDAITPDNAWDKLLDLANQNGVSADAFKACMADPKTAAQIKSTIEEGHSVNIAATPTTFVNNRRLVGPNATSLNQYVSY